MWKWRCPPSQLKPGAALKEISAIIRKESTRERFQDRWVPATFPKYWPEHSHICVYILDNDKYVKDWRRGTSKPHPCSSPGGEIPTFGCRCREKCHSLLAEPSSFSLSDVAFFFFPTWCVCGACVSCSLPDYSCFSISILAICNRAQYSRVALGRMRRL